MDKKLENILIIDYGSQYTQLIARRIRELEVFCSVYPYHKVDNQLIKELNPSAIILSGGPKSVLDKNSPKLNSKIFNLQKPVLGICYGMQLLTKNLGGQVKSSIHREYGHTLINIKKKSLIFKGIKKNRIKVWMSHGDNIKKIPKSFSTSSISDNNIIASIESKKSKIYCLQFHPEVFHTDYGLKIIHNFLFNISKIKNKFKIKNFIDDKVLELKDKIKDKNIICGVSGGVDSTVTAYLLNKAVNKNLFCIFVDLGLLRKNESNQVEKIFK